MSEQIFVRSSDVHWADVQGEVALMSTRNGCYYALDPIASAVWRKLDRSREVGQLAAELAGEYSGDPAQIEKDVRKTLAEWLEWSLITEAPAQP
jgi:hypothetical protein